MKQKLTEVQKLEQELIKAKNKELFEIWNKYLNELEEFAKFLVGKTILKWSSDYSYYIFKVVGYSKEHYYGQEHSPYRWINIKTSGHLNIYKGGCDNPIDFTFINVDKLRKSKYLPEYNHPEQIIITNVGLGITTGDIINTVELGKKQLDTDGWKNKPDFNEVYNYFLSFAYIVPNELFENGLKMKLDYVKANINFWNKYESVVKEAKKLEFYNK